jgi:GNAT superfamily N-acetyltransferase
MDVGIRDAQSCDLDTLVALLGELFSIEADFMVDDMRQRKGLSMMLDGCGKHRCVKVAEADGQVVGMCTAQILISTAQGGNVALVEDMVVNAPYRGMGIGRQLISALEKWAYQHGVTRLQLLADRTNSPALEFYGKMGWRSTRLICLRRQWKL